ncbi:aminodeoxychorismate synthase component I [Geodermatophilus sabuli]|uniref:Aminodeoxychorismate synthase component I n=1 Tax=Geodermatophilus sabuli TaxID=1564158 RepID=A0A7K3VVH8_9ACTN|nr:aminodeoxychorismate synthase component I [Geodermatophilus sabuli]NEK56348.1 aminodeoxychorismate synthase component I [Geodermatophilus sabuli]
MSLTAPWARFDDLTAGTALRFPPPHRVVTAERPEDVVPALADVERATAAGSWAFGYVGYEAAPGLDPALSVAGRRPGDPPLVWFGIGDPPAEVDPVAPVTGPRPAASAWTPDRTPEEHARAVAGVRAHIAAGETYQCNLTARLHGRVDGDPLAFYGDLALAQRGAYNAYLDLGPTIVASASPELFFEWSGEVLRTRPMKGTAARGRSTAEDRDRARVLRSSAKERAENLMIVDLLRNDVSRVAVTGSVTVPELFALERYPTVWQLTSEVTARTPEGTSLVDVFRALFPCGSVTGAPKARTMELIRDLEIVPRGVYCGAIGVIAPPGGPHPRARFSVAIRTAVVDRATGAGTYGAGGGITWDSEPAAEWAELLTKAAVLTTPAEDHQLLETLLFEPGRGLRNLERHLARLADSADWSGFACDLAAVRAELDAALSGHGTPARVRVALHRSGRVDVQTAPAPPAAAGPVTLAVDTDPVDSRSPWLQHKTTRRDVYTDRAARHPGADDVVLVNERGEVTETTIATLAVRLGGRWWTPPTAAGCLPGVERGRLLEEGRLHERGIHLADLLAAEELAVVSSLRGWRPARLLGPPDDDGRPPAEGSWRRPAPVGGSDR